MACNAPSAPSATVAGPAIVKAAGSGPPHDLIITGRALSGRSTGFPARNRRSGSLAAEYEGASERYPGRNGDQETAQINLAVLGPVRGPGDRQREVHSIQAGFRTHLRIEGGEHGREVKPGVEQRGPVNADTRTAVADGEIDVDSDGR